MKEFLSASGEQLYGLLPAVYRERDNAERDLHGEIVRHGDLACYLDACGHLLDLLRNTLDQRLADCFPDNPREGKACQDWLIPYFARLLDVRLVSPDVEGQRDEVANAITWRQQKGTRPCIEGICEAVLRSEAEVQEGWQRVALTPRVGTPLLSESVYGVECALDRRNPRELARHPGLPAVTPDLRCPSRAIRTDAAGPAVRTSRFNGVPYRWLQANPHGMPVSPGSYDDVSRRTPDLRTPDWRHGHAHPKRVLVYLPRSRGLFPNRVEELGWEGMLDSPLVTVTREYVEDGEAPGGKRLAHLSVRNRSTHPIRLTENLNLPVAGSDADLYSLEGLRIPGRLRIESDAGRIRRLRLRRTLVGELTATAEPGTDGLYGAQALVDAEDCLIGALDIAAGPVRLAACTVLRDALLEHITAQDCIFAGEVTDAGGRVPPYGSIDHCRVPPLLLDSPPGDPLVAVDAQTCTPEAPVFFRTDFGQVLTDSLTPDAGVLAPDTPQAVCFGARDGREMGAYHGGRRDDPVVIRGEQEIILGQDHLYEMSDLVFVDGLRVPAGSHTPLRLRRVACADLSVLSDALGEGAQEEPVVMVRDSLLGFLSVSAGLARLEHVTLLGETRFQRLQASDCLFHDLLGSGAGGAPTTADCIRYSRIPAAVLALAEAGLSFPSCTSDRPVFFHSDIRAAVDDARPGCGVLHPASPQSLCFGAEDGGELGAYHAERHCLRARAAIDKCVEHLPVGLEPALVPDPQLEHPPIDVGGSQYLWDRTVGGTGNLFGRSLAVDGARNPLVTGSFQGTVDFGDGGRSSAGEYDLFVLKLDSDGGYQWDRTFGGTGAVSSWSLAADGAGNPLVTGSFQGAVDFGDGERTSAGNSIDLFVLKLDGNGGYLWDRIFEGQGDEYGRSLAVDGAGNILITGHFVGTVDFGDGERTSDDNSYDVFVLKLDCDGGYLWDRTFGGTGNLFSWSLAVDGAGNILITGRFQGTVDFGSGERTSDDNSYDLFVLKLNGRGDYLWDRSFGGKDSESGNSLAVDCAGNALVTGRFQGRVDFGGGERISADNSNDLFVLKLDGDGGYLWDRTFGGTGYESGQGLMVDGAGNLLVTGYFRGVVDFGGGERTAGGLDFFVLELDGDGRYLCDRTFGGTGSDARGQSLTMDGAGNLLVTGYFRGTVDFGGGEQTNSNGSFDLFILKLRGLATGCPLVPPEPPSQTRWIKTFGGTGAEFGVSLAVDGAGNPLVTGYFDGTVDFGDGARTSAGEYDLFILKLDSSTGAHVWDVPIGGTHVDIGIGLAVDGEGNVLVTGWFQGTVNFGDGARTSAGDFDLFVLKLDSSTGAHVWDVPIGGTGGATTGIGLAVDGEGNVLVTGYFQGTVDFGDGGRTSAGDYDLFVLKLDGITGAHLWDVPIGGTDARVIGHSLAGDGKGNVLVTGFFEGAVDFGDGERTSAGDKDLFVLKLDSSTGAYLWDVPIGGTHVDIGIGLAVDGEGNVLVTGWFQGTVDFGDGARTSAGEYDLFVLKLDGSTGAHVWDVPIGRTGGGAAGISLAVDRKGNVLVTGWFQGTVDFGDGERTSAGDHDLFVLKLDGNGAYLWDRTFGGTGSEYGRSLAVDCAGNLLVTGYFDGTVDFGDGERTSAGDNDLFVLKLAGNLGLDADASDAERHCLRARAAIEKSLEHLPVGLEPVPVSDPLFDQPPPKFSRGEGAAQ